MRFTEIHIGSRIKSTEKAGYYVTVQYVGNIAPQRVGPFFVHEEEYLLKFVNMLEQCLKIHIDKNEVDYGDEVSDFDVWSRAYTNTGTLNGEPCTDKDYDVINRIQFDARIADEGPFNEDVITNYVAEYYDPYSDTHTKITFS